MHQAQFSVASATSRHQVHILELKCGHLATVDRCAFKTFLLCEKNVGLKVSTISLPLYKSVFSIHRTFASREPSMSFQGS